MMILAARFFSQADLLAFPVCLIVMFFIIRGKANQYADEGMKRIYFRAFYFKIFCVLVFVTLTEFYYRGGDTGLYFQATQDLRAAINDNQDHFWTAITSKKLTYKSPLFDYFYYDNYEYDITYNYMFSTANFFPPKLAVIPSFIFFNSYLSICMCFAFFALGGCIRLFKTFLYYYPAQRRDLALACLFLPSVGFWSSGLLKDPVCLGAVGFILYAALNVFIRKRKIIFSVAIMLACGTLLYFIKAYILLVLVLSIMIWLFAEFNKLIENKTLRGIFAGMTFIVGAVVGVLMVNYFTSMEAAQQYQLDNIMGNAEYQREMFAQVSQERGNSDSHFVITASNPVLLVLNGITATFFRPFIWEISSPIVVLAVLESSVFLFLTLYFISKRGFGNFFKVPFTDPRMLMAFIFSFVFAVAVGISTANFGALSRYKIPCMPFFLVLLILLYHKTRLQYPRWFSRLVNWAVPAANRK